MNIIFTVSMEIYEESTLDIVRLLYKTNAVYTHIYTINTYNM